MVISFKQLLMGMTISANMHTLMGLKTLKAARWNINHAYMNHGITEILVQDFIMFLFHYISFNFLTAST